MRAHILKNGDQLEEEGRAVVGGRGGGGRGEGGFGDQQSSVLSTRASRNHTPSLHLPAQHLAGGPLVLLPSPFPSQLEVGAHPPGVGHAHFRHAKRAGGTGVSL